MYRFVLSRLSLRVVIGIFIVAGVVGYQFFTPAKSLIVSQVTQPSTLTLKQSVRVLGEVSRVDTQTLTFGTSGKVQKIFVKEGQSVRAGDIIAQLDTQSLDALLREQSLAIQAAELQLQKLQTPAKEAEVLRTKKDISDASANALLFEQRKQDTLLTTKKEIETITAKISDLKRQQLLITDRINLLESNKNTTTETKSDTESRDQKAQREITDRLKLSLDATRLTISQLTADIDQIYGIDSATDIKTKNEIFVSGQSSALRQEVIDGYRSLKRESSEISAITALLASEQNTDLGEVQSRLSSLLTRSLTLTTRAIEGVNHSITDITFTDAILSGYESRLSGHASALTSRLQTVISERQAINTLMNTNLLESNTDLKIEDANISIKDLHNTYEKLSDEIRIQELQKISLERDKNTKIKDLDIQIAALASGLEVSQAVKSDLLDGADRADIALQKNAIARSKVVLDRQRADRDNMVIRATFSGVIDKIDFRVGDIASMTKGITISSPGLVNVESQIDQIDIVKIRVGNEAELRFDAYPGRTFSGVVSQIESYPQNTDGVVLYTTTIALQKSDADIFLNGMTAELNIEQSSERQAVSLPSIAVSQSGGEYRVNRLKSDREDRGAGEYQIEEYESVSVRLGETIGDRVEILSGVSMDDRILIPDFGYSDVDSKSIFGGPPERDNSNSVRQIN